MQILIGIGAVVMGYILGSILFGLLIVKIKTGKDVRELGNGRTGGTNVVRAAWFLGWFADRDSGYFIRSGFRLDRARA